MELLGKIWESRLDVKGGSKLKIEEVIPPGSTHPVKVYTDGNAQINIGKGNGFGEKYGACTLPDDLDEFDKVNGEELDRVNLVCIMVQKLLWISNILRLFKNYM